MTHREPLHKESPKTRERLLLLLLLAGGLLLLLHGLGERSLWGSEGRWAEIAREMVATSDYFVPRINGTPYRDKPILSYWLIAAAAPVTGGRVTEFTARLPSAAAAWVSLLLLYAMGRRLFDSTTGLLAAMILGTSFFLVLWGRTASADMLTTAGVLLTLWIFLRFEEARSRLWVYPLFLSMALNSLTKGLLGLVLPMAVLIPYSMIRRRWRWLFNGHSAAAMLLAAGLYLVPFFLDRERSGSLDSLFLVFKENVLRFFAPFDHREPFYFYFYEIFLLFAPWSLFLPAALWHQARRRANPSTWYPLVYFAAIFVFFTLSGSRRSYYLLPILPAASLIVAQALADRIRRGAPSGRWQERLLLPLPLFLVFLLLVAAAGILFFPPPFLADYGALDLARHARAAALAAGGAFLVLILYARARTAQAVVCLGLVVFSLNLYSIRVLTPEAESFRGLKTFCKSVNAMEIPPEDLAVFRQWRYGNLYFYLDRVPLLRIEEAAAARTFLSDPAHRMIVEARHLDLLPARAHGRVLLQERSGPGDDPEERLCLVRGGP